jgi:hypothetical protein
MSVRGEFRRILGDVVAALRAHGEGRSPGALVDALDRQAERAEDDLSGAAERALEILPSLPRPDRERDAALGDAAERLEAICKIILGRP